MYKIFKNILLCYLLPALISQSQAQDIIEPVKKKNSNVSKDYSVGFQLEGNLININVNQKVADKYWIRTNKNRYQGFRIGLFGRLDLKRFYFQSEINYFSNTNFIAFKNLKA